jgi:15-cis-phytoene synthase
MIDSLTDRRWEKNLLSLAKEALDAQVVKHNASMLGSRELEKGYADSMEVTRKHSRSFFLASGLLPTEKRKAVRALYAFCRLADDIVDEGQEPRSEALAAFKKTFLTSHPDPKNNLATAWADTLLKYRIPHRYAEQLLDGIAMDLHKTRYKNFEELAYYCYGVASTVGLMSMYITGFKSSEALPYAVKLGVALQLTNILRDVGEDWQTGRFYLPADELAAFDLDEGDVGSGIVNDRWRSFMRFQIKRTKHLYAESMPGIALLHPDGQPAVSAAASLYQGILDDIEKHDFDVFTRRAHVPTLKKISQLSRILVGSKLLPQKSYFSPHLETYQDNL